MKANIWGMVVIISSAIFLAHTISLGTDTLRAVDSLEEMDKFKLLVSADRQLRIEVLRIENHAQAIIVNAVVGCVFAFSNLLIFLVSILRFVRKPASANAST